MRARDSDLGTLFPLELHGNIDTTQKGSKDPFRIKAVKFYQNLIGDDTLDFSSQLLRTCKTIHQEAAPILYGKIFYFSLLDKDMLLGDKRITFP